MKYEYAIKPCCDTFRDNADSFGIEFKENLDFGSGYFFYINEYSISHCPWCGNALTLNRIKEEK